MAFNEACRQREISLQRYRIKTRIGWGEEERSSPQFVSFDVRLRFNALPRGCFTDQLDDTVCYFELCKRLQEVCTEEHRLIEKLTYDAYQKLKTQLPQEVLLWLKVTKETPPIPGLTEGASFTLGDWDAR